jgi:hypothetical protein
MNGEWKALVHHEDGSYTVTEKKLTDEEVADFREAMRDDGLNPSRGILLSAVISAAAWAAFFGIVWTLAHLPGIP